MATWFPRRLLLISLLWLSAGAAGAGELWPTGYLPLWSQGFPGAKAGDQRNVDLVWDGDGFALFWDSDTGDNADIEMQRFTAAGQPSGETVSISPAAADQKRPAVARVGSRLFVVWEDLRNDPSNRKGDLFATFVEADDSLSPAPGFAVAYSPDQQRDVEVAATPACILVVWEEREYTENSGWGPTEIKGQRLELDGDAIDVSPFEIGVGVEPTVAADGERFLVAYQSGAQQILGRFVDGDPSAVPLDGEAVLLASGGNGSDEPSLAFGGGLYALTWIREDSESRIEILAAQRFDSQGAPLPDDLPLAMTEIDEDAEHEIAWDGGQFVVAAQIGDEQAGVVEVDWVEPAEFTIVSMPGNLAQDPAIAASADGTLLVAWEDEIWETSQTNGENVFYVSRTPGGDFTTPEYVGLEGGGYGFVAPPAGASHAGGAYVIAGFSGFTGRADEIHVTRIDRSHEWVFEDRLVDTFESDAVWAFEMDEGVRFAWRGGDRTPWVRHISAEDAFSDQLPVPQQRVINQLLDDLIVPGSAGQPFEMGHDGEVVIACMAHDRGPFAGTGISASIIHPAPPGPEIREIVPAGLFAYSLIGIAGSGGNYVLVYQRSQGEGFDLFAQRMVLEDGVEVAPLGVPILLATDVGFGSISPKDSILPWSDGAEVVFNDGGDLRVAWMPWNPVGGALIETVPLASTVSRGALLSKLGERTVAYYNHRTRPIGTVSWTRGAVSTATTESIFDINVDFIYTDHVALPVEGEGLFLGYGSAQALVADRPRIDTMRRQDLGDGTAMFEFEVSGPAFGEMSLLSTTNLASWLYARTQDGITPIVDLDASGRGVLTGVFPVVDEQFWRGNYRP